MADTSKKVSELETASQVNNDDLVMLSQGSSQSGFASVKATILAIAQKIITGINFTSALETENKTITGAINEVAQGGGGGASELNDLDDVSISSPTNGQVLKYNSTSQEWENGNAGGGSGGHTILDDSGTSLAQEDDLQFKGTYSHDDSTNGKTVVEITREMTQAEYDLLSADEKKGIIRITDDNYVCGANESSFDNTGTSFEGDNVQEVLEEVDSKIDDMDNGISLLTIPANTYSTWSLALQALYVEYNKLTTEQKKRCSIIRSDDVVYKCTAISSAFSTVYATSTTRTAIQSLFLQSGIFLHHNLEGATISTTSWSDGAQNYKIELRLN